MSEPLHESADQAGEHIDEHAWAADHVASYVAAGLATTDRVRMSRHLRTCEECRRTVAELQTLDEEMRQLFADVHPSPDLETRTVQAVRRAPRPVRARLRRAAWSGLMKAMMGAAAVMLFVGVGAFLSESPKYRESVANAARNNINNNLRQGGIAIHNYRSRRRLKSNASRLRKQGVRSGSNGWSDDSDVRATTSIANLTFRCRARRIRMKAWESLMAIRRPSHSTRTCPPLA